MKITKHTLKQLIKEELQNITEGRGLLKESLEGQWDLAVNIVGRELPKLDDEFQGLVSWANSHGAGMEMEAYPHEELLQGIYEIMGGMKKSLAQLDKVAIMLRSPLAHQGAADE